MICATLPIAEIYFCLMAYRQYSDRSQIRGCANAADDTHNTVPISKQHQSAYLKRVAKVFKNICPQFFMGRD